MAQITVPRPQDGATGWAPVADTLLDQLKSESNDQDNRVGALESTIAALQTTVAILQSQTGNPSSGGGINGVLAPPPSGGDDTATIQSLLTLAQNTGGTLFLLPGVYLCSGLVTAASFNQPKIVGAGMKYTTLKSTTGGTILKFKGGSGQMSGGYVSDLAFTGTGAIGLTVADANGVTGDRLLFSNLAEGIRFHNEGTGSFAEFNQFSAEFRTNVILPVRYMKTSGNESFHGSGLTLGSIINQNASATGPMIQIDAGCFPYQAPMSATVFTRAVTPIFSNANTFRVPEFVGTLMLENFVDGAVIASPTAAKDIILVGNLAALGGRDLVYGSFNLAYRSYYNDVSGQHYDTVTNLTSQTG